MEDLTGKQLGQYQLVALLGEGGMAVVYKAYQPNMERCVALKILPRHYAAEPDFIRRFKQEARIIASLEHPNVLPVYDYGEADGYTYIVMRYIEGGKTLADLMRGQSLSLSQIHNILSKIAAALDYSHSRGVVHRDVKPSNVLIDQQDNLLLSDFGLAKVFVSSPKFTTSGVFLGTPTYASPEQCLGRSDLDGRSDVYSLGVMLYEMTTGRPPFDAETPMAIVVKHINDPLPLPRKVNPALPESVERVILKALAKQPNGRYQTAGEMAKSLAGTIAEASKESTMGIPSKPEPSVTTVAKRHPIPTWGWALGCLVMLAMLAIAVGLGIKIIPLEIPVVFPTSRRSMTLTRTAVAPAVGVATQTAETVSAMLTNAAPTASRSSKTLTPPQPTETPSLPAIPIIQQFEAPGLARSIAWDGTNLWVAEGDFAESVTLLKLDSTGNTTEVYIINDRSIYMPPYGFSDDVGMVGVENSLWLDVCGPVREYRLVSGSMEEVSRFAGIDDEPGCTGGGNPITWDGQSFWLARSAYLYQKSADGNLLTNFEYSFGIRALAWDGDYLWASTGMFASTGGRTLDVVNLDGGSIPIAGFPIPAGMGEFIQGLAWDGKYLWALSNNKIYQLDISEPRAYVAEQYRLRAQTTALTEVLRPDPEVGADRVKVVNNTSTTLRITFEYYNYVVEVPPNTTQTITPPENAFVAEVPDLPPIRGSYISLSGCTWYYSARLDTDKSSSLRKEGMVSFSNHGQVGRRRRKPCQPKL
jgi:serine/threonine protein kinase